MFMLWIIAALVPFLWAFGASTSALGALIYYALLFDAVTLAIQLTAVLVNELWRGQPRTPRGHGHWRTSAA